MIVPAHVSQPLSLQHTDLVGCRRICGDSRHIRPMLPPDLTEDEHAELVRIVSDAITKERYFLSPRMKRLKSMLAKIHPPSAERTVAPYLAPKAMRTPNLLYRKLRGVARRG
jgi:hypothetical protein